MAIVIDNFSIDVYQWVVIDTLVNVSVDVTDSDYGIRPEGTYFIHDNQVVFTTLSGIINGYTCYYSPTHISSSGVTNLTIHVENFNNETIEKAYYFLYGYHVLFNEIVDWGAKKDVVITVDATNTAVCSNTEGEAFYFETADLKFCELGATIRPVGWVGLAAAIYPQNTFFFYGRTYSITVSGIKDFSGNELAPYTFTFTIEDPTN